MKMPRLAILGVPLALAACGTPQLETGVAPVGAFSPLSVPGEVFADNDAVAAYFLGTVGRSSPSQQQFGDYPGDAGDQLLLFSAEGLEDDSVRAMQWRVVVEQVGEDLRVTNAGVRQRCARSGSSEWTTALCP